MISYTAGIILIRLKETDMNIRSSAKEIIIQKGSVLLTKNQMNEECFYLYVQGIQSPVYIGDMN